MEFTREQLFNQATRQIEIAEITLEVLTRHAEGVRSQKAIDSAMMDIAIAKIAMAALTAPNTPPDSVMAKGRAADAANRRQGARMGWGECLEVILRGVK